MDAKDELTLLPKTLIEASIRRVESGDWMYIVRDSLMRLAFRRDDPASRHVVLATLLEAKLKGRVVAQLVGVSPARVTKVKKAVARGGLRAAADVGKAGRKPELQGERLEQARALRERGATHREIAKRMGVANSTVSVALRGMPAGEAGHPAPRPGRLPAEPEQLVDEDERADDERVHDERADEGADETDSEDDLRPCERRPPGPAEHPSAYAGTVFGCAVVPMLGVPQALAAAVALEPTGAIAEVGGVNVHANCASRAGMDLASSVCAASSRAPRWPSSA